MNTPTLIHAGAGAVRDLVLGYHMAPGNAQRLVELAPDAIHMALAKGPYSVKAGAIERLDRIRDAAAKRHGCSIRRVIGVAWSAGCGGWRSQLEAGQDPDALVLADGMHSTLPPAPSHLDTWRRYFRAACDGERVLLASSSRMTYVERLKPPEGSPYASVQRVLRAVTAWPLEAWGSREKPAITSRGSAEVWCVDSKDVDGDAHMWHAQRCLPRMFARALELVGATSDTDPVLPALRPERPLRERALAVALAEAQRWGSSPVPRERVAEYFGRCERNGAIICDWLSEQVRSGVGHSFCAAAVGWCEAQAALLGEPVPPWRAGARETERDAKAARRGRWLPQSAALAGELPPPGALAVYTRGDPAKGLGHVERVIEATQAGYRSVGANEAGGRWYVDPAPVPYTHARLLGFVVDGDESGPPMRSEPPVAVPSDFIETPASEDDWRELRLLPLEIDWDQLRADRDAAIRGDSKE